MSSLLDAILDQYRLWRAERLLEEGRLLDASARLSRVSSQRGRGVRIWRLKGRLLLAAGLPGAAVQCFFEASRCAGATLGQILELAWSLMNARDFQRAEAVLVGFIDRFPDHRLAPLMLAHLYRAQGRCETALGVLRRHRPRRVAAKYAPLVPPPLELGWQPERAWLDALAATGRDPTSFQDLAAMALDRDGRDELICAFDEIAVRPGGLKGLAHGVARAVDSGAPWLIDWVRRCEPILRLHLPRGLPAFIARHGDVRDRGLLLAGLAAGGHERLMSAAALVSLGFEEYQEVLDELRQAAGRNVPVSADSWQSADAVLGRASELSPAL
ncbi:MAG: hypothetical protein H6807_14605 [Planctomycetes bacterium]|nr:hypothetical protein [Planctomycetota bacterium]